MNAVCYEITCPLYFWEGNKKRQSEGYRCKGCVLLLSLTFFHLSMTILGARKNFRDTHAYKQKDKMNMEDLLSSGSDTRWREKSRTIMVKYSYRTQN